MINFRFHIVSLTAVFLALAIGIVVGVSVIREETVNGLQDGLRAAERRADRVDELNNDLRRNLGRWSDFSEQAGDELVEGRLRDVPVVIITVAGVDRDIVSSLRGSVGASGANVGGVLRLTAEWTIDEPSDVRRLADAAGVTESGALAVRRAALNRLAAELAEGTSALLGTLQQAGFVDLDGPVDPAAVVVPTSRFLVVSTDEAAVANADLAVPLTLELARQAETRVVAADDLSPDADERDSDEAAERFVLALRDEGSPRVATVDNAADFRGRVATVLALAALGAGQVGDYGVGPGADRMLPELGR